MNEQKRWLINNSETAESKRLVALGGTFGINLSNYSKKQIRTNFDLRNSSDLLRLVTRTGISPAAKIFARGSRERAPVALLAKCEPNSASLRYALGYSRVARRFLLAALVSELPSPCSQNANPCVCVANAVSINDTASKKKEHRTSPVFFLFW